MCSIRDDQTAVIATPRQRNDVTHGEKPQTVQERKVTTEQRARIELAKMGFAVNITPTGHYFLVSPSGDTSLRDHGCLESAEREAKRWGGSLEVTNRDNAAN